jgi:hypothetical protein
MLSAMSTGFGARGRGRGSNAHRGRRAPVKPLMSAGLDITLRDGDGR